MRGPLAQMVAAVSQEFGVPIDEIKSKSRSGAINPARYAFIWLAEINGTTRGKLGQFLARDRSTIYSARKMAERYRRTCESYKHRTDALRALSFEWERGE